MIIPTATAAETPIPSILVVKEDSLSAIALASCAVRAFPMATICTLNRVSEAAIELGATCWDILLTGIHFSNGDMLELLHRTTRQHPARVRHVLVVTTSRDLRALSALRSMPISGIFDCTAETPDKLTDALTLIVAGKPYWSSTIIDAIQRECLGPTALSRQLTRTEELVLAVIGDGCDDSEAAHELTMAVTTIATIRQKLHRKLGINHRGELVRLAAQYGYVRFTPQGVQRPGFAILSDSRRAVWTA